MQFSTFVITHIVALVISHSTPKEQVMLFDLINAGSRLSMGFSCCYVVSSLHAEIDPSSQECFVHVLLQL